MKSTINFLLLYLAFNCIGYELNAQSISIQPYLQDVSPHAIHILWETNIAGSSTVEWGLTEALGNETNGISYNSNGSAMIHEVHIQNLERFTKYFYRVRTNTAVSEIFNFKTPPFASDDESFRILAMSDMQRDGSFPNKFLETVEQGVLEYLESEFGGDLIDNLALVMIPGDLVVTGSDFGSWQSDFFNPATKLLNHIPVYPVLGNHEANTPFYFSYFKLPENGTQGFEEHWWFKDYGNVRILGLNSNSPFDGTEQLAWLDNVLTTSCEADSIDFVFAQLHHPHKSELWTPGESNFTGDVIARLEQFTTTCGKPSIHFFGHTHGYSRGQSRDHKHLWINVASAGGAIDNWGEFPNFDYDEFSVSQDEYGFVTVDVINDEDPKLVIKRISRGDQDTIIDNEIVDSLTIRLTPSDVTRPTAVSPINNTELAPECVTLKGSEFASPNSAADHGQSHWQVSSLGDNFNNLIFESWKNFENWYFDIDTQLGDDLTDEQVFGLEEFTNYQWRVRYRDKEMNWSEWSMPEAFLTSASVALPNLIQNPGAEDDLNNWSIEAGVVEALEAVVCDGIVPQSGNKYFAVGGLCDHSEVGRLVQNINLNAYIDSIETGIFPVSFGGYLSNYNGSDLPEMKIIFLDQNLVVLGESNILSTLNSSWTFLSETMNMPSQTKNIRVELQGTRNSGTDNDSYFDNIFVSVGTPKEIDCDGITSSINYQTLNIQRLFIYPNPTQNNVRIKIPESLAKEFSLTLVNSDGLKLKSSYQKDDVSIMVDLTQLPIGSYSVWLRDKKGSAHFGRIIKAR